MVNAIANLVRVLIRKNLTLTRTIVTENGNGVSINVVYSKNYTDEDIGLFLTKLLTRVFLLMKEF